LGAGASKPFSGPVISHRIVLIIVLIDAASAGYGRVYLSDIPVKRLDCRWMIRKIMVPKTMVG